MARGTANPPAVLVQPFAHLHALAAFPVCFPTCGFSCFASVRLSGWLVVSVRSVLLQGGGSLVCAFQCKLCFAKGTLLSLNGIIHLNTCFSFYTRKSDEIQADTSFSSAG